MRHAATNPSTDRPNRPAEAGASSSRDERFLSVVFREAPRWLLVVTLLSAPLLYGSTRDWAVNVLTAQLFAIALLELISRVRERRPIRVPPLLLALVAFLVGYAWWMTLNAKFYGDPASMEFRPRTAVLTSAPGSIDFNLSLESALLITGLLVIVVLVAELSASRVWRVRILAAMGVAGGLVVLLGGLQRLTGAEEIYWAASVSRAQFFGPYRNHDNAAALINVGWPMAAGMFLIAVARGPLWARITWGGLLVIGLSGAVVTGSRAGALIALLLLLALAGWIVRRAVRGRLGAVRLSEALVSALLLLIIMAAVAVFTGVDFSLQRWANLKGELTPDNYRWLAYQVCLDMVPESGWCGFGPGTFQMAFPYFTHRFDDALKGRWTHAHQDYFQTIIEWGYIGAAAWAVVVAGGIVMLAIALRRNRPTSGVSRPVQSVVLLLGIAGLLLHALVDFPLQIASVQLYAAVLLGTAWGARQWIAGETSTDAP